MPDINGFELAKLIKSNSRTKHIPIIFVTAIFKNNEFIRQGFEVGAIDYITKPIDSYQLLGCKLHDYIHYKNNQNIPHLEKECKIFNVLKTQEIYTNKNEIFVKSDGNLLAVSLRVTPLYDKDIFSGIVVVFKPL